MSQGKKKWTKLPPPDLWWKFFGHGSTQWEKKKDIESINKSDFFKKQKEAERKAKRAKKKKEADARRNAKKKKK